MSKEDLLNVSGSNAKEVVTCRVCGKVKTEKNSYDFEHVKFGRVEELCYVCSDCMSNPPKGMAVCRDCCQGSVICVKPEEELVFVEGLKELRVYQILVFSSSAMKFPNGYVCKRNLQYFVKCEHCGKYTIRRMEDVPQEVIEYNCYSCNEDLCDICRILYKTKHNFCCDSCRDSWVKVNGTPF